MPNENDWDSLKNTIKKYGNEIVKLWHDIDQSNICQIAKKKFKGSDLFQFLLTNNHFFDANTVAAYIPFLNDDNINFICQKHNEKYIKIIKILCTDKLIICYEENMMSENYRKIISQQYEKIINMDCNTKPILNLVYQFKFLTHKNMKNFYQSIVDLNEDYLTYFCQLYFEYLQLVPLIYRLINCYYLEYMKYQHDMINSMSDASYIVVAEYFDNIKNFLTTIPDEYIDYNYTDNTGYNIPLYLSTIHYPLDTIYIEICQLFFDKLPIIPLTCHDNNGNSILHHCALNDNNIFLEKFIQLFEPDDLTEIILFRNINNKSFFDILLDRCNYHAIGIMVEHIPETCYTSLADKIIDDPSIADNLPEDHKMNDIYSQSINGLITNLTIQKNNVLYDINQYNHIKSSIIKLLLKCNITSEQNYFINWLATCIEISDISLFKTILEKYLSNKMFAPNLDKNISAYGEPLIIYAIREQNIEIVKLLLSYSPNLKICDATGCNAIIVALNTDNLYLIQILKNYMKNDISYAPMNRLVDRCIVYLQNNQIYDIFSVHKICIRIWKTIEYLCHYLMNLLYENNQILSNKTDLLKN